MIIIELKIKKIEEIMRSAVVVGDAWLFNKILSSDPDDSPIKLNLQIKELVIISFFTIKTKIQDKEGILY